MSRGKPCKCGKREFWERYTPFLRLWVAAVNGFAGIKERDGELVCEPSLSDRWKGMSFKLMFRNRLYMIEIKDGKGAMTEL